MSGDERRYVPPDPTTTTDSAARAAPAADPGATNPDDPNATDPDPPGAAPDAPGDAPNETVPDVPEPADRTPDEAVPREASGPQDVRVAPLNVPPPGPGRSGGTVEFPDPDVPATPPPSTPPPSTPPVRRKRGENVRGPLVALGIGVLVVAVALAAMFALGGGDEDDGASPEPAVRPSEAAPSGAAGGAAPVPTDAPPTASPTPTPSGSPPTATGTPPDGTGGLQGDGVTYAIVQRDSGYYEGAFTLTNRTGAPLPTWRLSFRIPGADVRSAWGGRLVQGGERVVIENTPGAAAVPPGGTATITFGAAGTPAAPAECVLNGAACGL